MDMCMISSEMMMLTALHQRGNVEETTDTQRGFGYLYIFDHHFDEVVIGCMGKHLTSVEVKVFY